MKYLIIFVILYLIAAGDDDDDDKKNCPITCKKCKGGSGKCSECYFLSYLKDDKCVLGTNPSCGTNCATCDSSKCLTCVSQDYYTKSKDCAKCPSHCQSCTKNTCTCVSQCSSCSYDKCLTCINNYQISNGKCVKKADPKCGISCFSCNTNGSQCAECLETNYYTKVGSANCTQCPSWCSVCTATECTTCASPCLTCTFGQCLSQSTVIIEDTPVIECETECIKCDTTTGSCLECNDSHFVVDGNCYDCTSEYAKPQKMCNYKNCEDKIWTWGEQCDDGNTNSRDGCTNCIIEAQYQCNNIILEPSQCYQCPNNCLTCSKQQSEIICSNCLPEHTLLNNICMPCAEYCIGCEFAINKCIKCRYLVPGLTKCGVCETIPGLYTDYVTSDCYTICGDSIISGNEQCDDGNQLSGDGYINISLFSCDTECNLEKQYVCIGDICVIPSPPVPSLAVNKTDYYNSLKQFTISYDMKIQKYNSNQLIDIIITNMQLGTHYQQNVDYQITNDDSELIQLQIDIEIDWLTTSISQQMTVQFINPTQIQSKDGTQQQVAYLNIDMPDHVKVSAEQIQSTAATVDTNLYLLYIILGLAGASILFGGINIFYNLLDLLQMMSYLKYINTQLPYNIQTYLELFQFAQLKFLSQYIDIQQFLNEYYDFPEIYIVPDKIGVDGFVSLALINCQELVIVWITFIIIYLFSKLMLVILVKIQIIYNQNVDSQNTIILKVYLLITKAYITNMCAEICSSFLYSGFLRTHMSTAYDYSFVIVLNYYNFDIYSDVDLIVISCYLTIFMTIIYIAIFHFSMIQCSKPNCQIKTYVTQNEFGALFEDIRYSKLGIYYNVLILLKKLLFMVFLILLYDYPLYQAANIAMLSLFQVIFIYHFDPIEQHYERFKQLTCEALMFITEVILLMFVIDDQFQWFNSDNRSQLGWGCVATLSLIIILQMVTDIIQQWRLLIKIFGKVKRFIQYLMNSRNKLSKDQVPKLSEDILRQRQLCDNPQSQHDNFNK